MILFNASTLLGMHDGQRAGNRLIRFALVFSFPSPSFLFVRPASRSYHEYMHYRASAFFPFKFRFRHLWGGRIAQWLGMG
jgi:hypothetical protein